MKIFTILALVSLAYTEIIEEDNELSGAYGFIKKYAIPLADHIRVYEEQYSILTARGSTSKLEQFPYLAGVIINFIGTPKTGVCGGSLVSSNRVITAAHCWYDGESQGYQSTVVLGSTFLYIGGTRLTSRTVVLHPQWDPRLNSKDVAVIYLPSSVSYSAIISPISLPSGAELNETYVGEIGVASGFGVTSNNASISPDQALKHVSVTVISNLACRRHYHFSIESSNMCTSNGTCNGDSGGPLAITRNNKPLLIGVTSFSFRNCESSIPVVFARVTSFITFFNDNINDTETSKLFI